MKRLKALLQKSTSTLLALGCALLIGIIIMLAIGENPIDGFYQLFRGAFGNKFNFGSTLEKFVPLLITGLAYMVAERAGMFNLGVEGELYLGALAAAAVAIYLPRNWPGWLIVLLSIIGSMIVGALWALIPALLKLHLRVNEVCSTICCRLIISAMRRLCGIGESCSRKSPARSPTVVNVVSAIIKLHKNAPGYLSGVCFLRFLIFFNSISPS